MKALVVALLFLLIACSPHVPTLIPEPDKTNEKVLTNTDVEVSNPEIDILFVVDNSYSMDSHQRNLIANIDTFVSAFFQRANIDYHIGVLSTDMENGWGGGSRQKCCGELIGTTRFVSRSTVNGVSELGQNLRIGVGGSATETVFDPVAAALQSPLSTTINNGFYRSNAFLALIFITDAEDQGKYTPKAFHDLLVNIKGQADKIVGFGVVVPTGVPDSQCPRDDYSAEPVRIEQFLDLLPNRGKNILSLCDPDYGNRIAQMADELVKYVGNTILLNRPPIPETIRVMFGSSEIPKGYKDGWSFDAARNAIILGDEIKWPENEPPGTKVQVFFDAAVYRKK